MDEDIEITRHAEGSIIVSVGGGSILLSGLEQLKLLQKKIDEKIDQEKALSDMAATDAEQGYL